MEIIGIGCRIFYGVKAVRFIMASHSQLKYGARLINSYLGNNATISCCEVLNSLIFPAHEQHHNNSFLCAALVMGQSNMAAGATIGSNHNSRGADGEIVAGRGFWPGLCVSLKHNSIFSSFNIIAKGDYPAELNIKLPFSLISQDVHTNQLVVIPGYWFKYNMYALARNAWKYIDRDRRTDKTQLLEYDFLAPDSIQEIAAALPLLEQFTGEAYRKKFPEKKIPLKETQATGKKLLESNDTVIADLDIYATGFENSTRKVQLLKVGYCYQVYKEMIQFYLAKNLIATIEANAIGSVDALNKLVPAKPAIQKFTNIGGQLTPEKELEKLLTQIRLGKIKNWLGVHAFYQKQSALYPQQKLVHAIAIYQQVFNINLKRKLKENIKKILLESIGTKTWMTENIYASRAKDYKNEFRKMVYENEKEMNAVIGSLAANSFIKQEMAAMENYGLQVKQLIKKLKL